MYFRLQNVIAKTFGSVEINYRSNDDDGNKNKCPHEIGILTDYSPVLLFYTP